MVILAVPEIKIYYKAILIKSKELTKAQANTHIQGNRELIIGMFGKTLDL